MSEQQPSDSRSSEQPARDARSGDLQDSEQRAQGSLDTGIGDGVWRESGSRDREQQLSETPWTDPHALDSQLADHPDQLADHPDPEGLDTQAGSASVSGLISSDALRAGPIPHASLPAVHMLYPSLLETFSSLLSVIVIALFVLTFIAQPFRIPSESMERTLLVGDFLLVNKAIYGTSGSSGAHGRWPHLLPYKAVGRGDIIVFHFPLDPADHVVKRVAGLPGDRVHLDRGQLFINGSPVAEPYAIFDGTGREAFRDQFPAPLYTDPGVDTHWWMQMRKDVRNGELIVPAGSYFVLGDNRDHSRDSRYWGFVPVENIVGRPFVIYFSLRRETPSEAMQDDRLGHDKVSVGGAASFARWDRMFRVVR